MNYQKSKCTLTFLYLCSLLHAIAQDQACDKSRCEGPIRYYEELGCVPVYGCEDSCCPVKYNCDHLRERSADKCYYLGHVYEVDEPLREEDAQPCDIGCYCSEGYDGPAQFNCAVVDCFLRQDPECYLKKSHDQCCDGPQVCHRPVKISFLNNCCSQQAICGKLSLCCLAQNDTEIARCEVDGETYLDGQSFTPQSDPKQYCICSAGYTGENVEPFCKDRTSYPCGVELRNSYVIYNNCTPVFDSDQNPATDCSVSFRCQNENDRVVECDDSTETGVTPGSDEDCGCIFGNLTMKIGDKLNSGTYYDSVCLKCVCKVPPLPTCQRLPDDECDVTKHGNFDD